MGYFSIIWYSLRNVYIFDGGEIIENRSGFNGIEVSKVRNWFLL